MPVDQITARSQLYRPELMASAYIEQEIVENKRIMWE